MKALRTVWGRLAAWAALFSMCLQVLLPLGQAVAASNRTGEALFSAPMIICTLYGVKVIDPATGEELPSDKGGSGDYPVCPAFGIGKLSLNTAVTVELPEPPALTSVRLAPVDNAQAGFILRHIHNPRAPPEIC